MKWSEMSPEQRDRLVAEKVMQWVEEPCKLDDGHPDIAEIEGFWECRTCGFQGDWGENGVPQIHNHIALPPKYSQSLDEVWKIVQSESFNNAVLQYRTEDSRIPSLKPVYFCQLNRVNGEFFTAFAKTPQDAICLAALSAYDVAIRS